MPENDIARAIDALPPLGEVIRAHGLNARHRLGQHFLLDLNLTARIARVAGDLRNTDVIEVGPGPGGLTRALLRAGARRVIAVERDDRCIAALGDLVDAAAGRLEIVSDDALKTDTVAMTSPPRRVVANLPYNISTPLLLGWLREAPAFASLTLMFQREVADRLVAQPRTKAYGRLSILAQRIADTRRDFNVSRDAFTPPPKVMSTVVTLTPRGVPITAGEFSALEAVTAAAFGQRRKMLRSSLAVLDIDPASIGIDATRRAEELSVEEFCALAGLFQAKRSIL